MKAYPVQYRYFITSLLLLTVICSGCLPRLLRPTSYLDDKQALVKKVKLVGIDKQYTETIYQYVQRDIRPNSKINLFLYNLLNANHGKYKTGKIKKIGEAPNLLDSSLVEISRNEIQKYLYTKGFFNARVKSEMEVKRKKATITFTAERGPVFRFGEISWDIPDTAIKRIYEENREKITRIHQGKRYDQDSIMFEIDTLYSLLRTKGYYDYKREYSHVELDTFAVPKQANLLLTVGNPEGKDRHEVFTIDSTTFTINNSRGEEKGDPKITPDSGQVLFVDYSRKIAPAYFGRYIFMKRGDLFDNDKLTLTTNRLYDLNIFRSLKVDFEKTGDSTSRLNAVISATPLKQMVNRVEGEYTFNSGRNGFNLGNTYTNRNLLGGAEQLDLKLRYGILFDSGVTRRAFSRVFNRDFQAGASLIIPRLLVPFGIPITSKNGLPHTTFSTSLQIFDQPGAFKNRIFINSVTYDWVETAYKLHSLTPLNVEFRNGKLDPAFRASLEDQGYQLYITTNERSYLSLGSQYSFTYNRLRLNTNQNFTYLKASADMAGNTLNLFYNALNFRKEKGDRTIFGQRYLQYAKGEIDLRWYRSLGGDRQFIARIDPGIGIPIGNTSALPFEKNFYAGGSSGNRAWQARTLGPGQYNRASIIDATTRSNFRNLDQLGEIKIEGNLEYRFLLVRNFFGARLKGATFTDFGNIWRLRERDTINNPGGNFKLNTFARQIALGAGAGLRFDLQYFVFRFDVGAKIRDPQFVDPAYGESPWVVKHLFSDKAAFKDRYDATNLPDKYRFLQYNFGIGLPF